MTVVLCDSIQAEPLPIAEAIIPMAVTHLVTAKKKFSEKPELRSQYSEIGEVCPLLRDFKGSLRPAALRSSRESHGLECALDLPAGIASCSN